MASRYRMAAILFFSLLISICSGCNVDDVAVYQVKMDVLWSDEMFPEGFRMSDDKWSPVFGQSHNKSYALYHIGEVSRPLLQDLAQSGNLDHMAEEGDEEPKVYDQFSADVEAGVAMSMVFVDGGHSLVSLISMMVPSPHWFIGVDSLDLCVDSSWVDQLTLDLEPLDVGGNLDGEPPKAVKKITHLTADFSFHHRKFRQLPPIAKVEFTKIKEYSTKELNDIARKELASKLIKLKRKDLFKSFTKPKPFQGVSHLKEKLTTKNNLDQLNDLEEDPVGTPMPNDPENNVIVVRKATTDESHPADLESLQNMDDVVLAVANGKKMGLSKHLPRHFRSRLHHAVNRKQGRDCKVSEWSDWSGCSDPCGSGVMVRVRSVTQKRKGDGRACPALIEKKPCGHKCRGDGDYIW